MANSKESFKISDIFYNIKWLNKKHAYKRLKSYNKPSLRTSLFKKAVNVFFGGNNVFLSHPEAQK